MLPWQIIVSLWGSVNKTVILLRGECYYDRLLFPYGEVLTRQLFYLRVSVAMNRVLSLWGIINKTVILLKGECCHDRLLFPYGEALTRTEYCPYGEVLTRKTVILLMGERCHDRVLSLWGSVNKTVIPLRGECYYDRLLFPYGEILTWQLFYLRVSVAMTEYCPYWEVLTK